MLGPWRKDTYGGEASYDNGKLLREASIEYIFRMYSRVSFALIRVGGGGGVCPPDGSKEG